MDGTTVSNTAYSGAVRLMSCDTTQASACMNVSEWSLNTQVPGRLTAGSFSTNRLTNLAVAADRTLVVTGDARFAAWCFRERNNADCNAASSWNRAALGQDAHGVLRKAGADYALLRVGGAQAYLARCRQRCWLPENWVGGLMAVDTKLGEIGEQGAEMSGAGDVVMAGSYDGKLRIWYGFTIGFSVR